MLCIHVRYCIIPDSECDWHYNECDEGSDISQSIGLQGGHSLMEVEVVWYIESHDTFKTRHLICARKSGLIYMHCTAIG